MKPALTTQRESHSWRGRPTGGVGLALATILAILYVAVWQAANGRNIAGLLKAASVDDTLSWVLLVLLSKVLPIALLGGVLARLKFPGSATGSHPIGGGFFAALHTVGRLLMPTLVIGSLFMLERPGVDPVTIVIAWLLPIGICFIWFWTRPFVQQGTFEPTALGWRDVLIIGVTLLTLVSALVAGLSFQLSAIIALGVLIALSLLDADVRQRPNIILHALARSGIAFSWLLVVAAAVGLILMVLDQTGLPIDVARLLAGATGEAKLPLLVLTTIAAIGMGLIMPGFAAYLITAALIGPALRTVGIASPTAHLLIFVVSAVAVAIGCGARSKAA